MIQKLTGWIKPQTLQGNLNVVPSSIGSASLQSKIVYPRHSEQVITPDDDFDGLSLVTVKPTPRLPAFAMSVCEGNGEIFYGDVVENVALDGMGIFITAEAIETPDEPDEPEVPETPKTHALYNGVRLPKIPIPTHDYQYVWIRLGNDGVTYDLIYSYDKWYVIDGNLRHTISKYSWYKANANATEWQLNMNLEDAGPFGIAGGLLWANYDVPNGSADATDIYLAGSDPVPTD